MDIVQNLRVKLALIERPANKLTLTVHCSWLDLDQSPKGSVEIVYSKFKKLDAKEILLENIPYCVMGLFYLDISVSSIEKMFIVGEKSSMKSKSLADYIRKKIVSQDK